MNVNRARVKWYRFSYACHRLAWPVRWLTLSCALVVLVEFFVFPSPLNSNLHFLTPGRPSAIAFINLTFRVAGAWVVVFGLLTLISGWFDIWFRYAAWWVARFWRSGLVLVVAAALVIWRDSLGIKLWTVLKMIFVMGVLLKVTAAILLLLILYGVYRARGQLVILPFANYTGDDNLKCSVEGLAPMLINELSRITRIYAAMDDTRLPEKSTPGLEKGLPATVSVEDVGGMLQSAVSSQSVVKFWGIEVPVGSLLRLFGQLARGPRLNGSLHKEGERLVLIASIDRGPQQGASWRVTPGDLAAAASTSATELVSRMMDQLAYRVFADRVPAISQRWQAVRCYAEGLRVLRITTRTQKEKDANLRHAERAFLQALGEDNKFARNHYNLGVVYTALGERDAAQAAYYQAAKEDTGLTQAYYGLALGASNRYDFPSATGYCDQVISQSPKFARAWDLKGISLRKIQEQRFGELKAGEHPEVWPEILETREIGAALAWRALCRAGFRRRGVDDAREVARKCVRGVAVAQAMVLRIRLAESIMAQALYLTPTDADLHFELGKILTNPAEKSSLPWRLARCILPRSRVARVEDRHGRKRRLRAADHLRTATRIDARRGLYWAHLAECLSGLFKSSKQADLRVEARAACERALDYSSGADGEANGAWKVLPATLQAIGEHEAIRIAYQYAMDYAAHASQDVQKRLRGLVEAIREDKDVRAACERAEDDAAGAGRASQDSLRAAFEVLGEVDVRAVCERAVKRASGKDKETITQLQTILEVLGQEQIRAACEWAINYATDVDKKAQEKLRVALEKMRGDTEAWLTCERALVYTCGADTKVLNRLWGVLKAIRDGGGPALCEVTAGYASRTDRKAWDRVRWVLGVITDDKILAACQRAMVYASGTDNDRMTATPSSENAEAPGLAAMSEYLRQLQQDHEDRDAYLNRLQDWENWLNLTLLLKNMSGQGGSWDSWAYGLAAGNLAQELVQSEPVRAQKLADRAILSLKRLHLGAIRELGLYGTLARACLNQAKPELLPQALFYAQRAVALNPEGDWERSILAEVFWALGEYGSAEAAWNTRLDLSPDAESWTSIGAVHWNLGVALRDPAERKKAFRRVIEVFGRALTIIESKNLGEQNLPEQVISHGYVHYWIGRFHSELMEFDQAIAHLQIAKNMGYKPLESTVYLGLTRVEAKDYEAAERNFREAVVRVRDQRRQHKRLAESDSGLGEDTPMNELVILTYLGWSFAYSDRGVRLTSANRLATKTRRLIRQLDKSKVQEVQRYESSRFDCVGYAQLRAGNVDAAVTEFERSLELRLDAGSCVRLAEAYLMQAKSSAAIYDSCVRRALGCCVRAHEADLRQQYGQRIKDLENRLGTRKRFGG